MSSAHISHRLRQKVATRAEHLCEYCLIHEEDAYVELQIDHIISKKHGGQTTAQNRALVSRCTTFRRPVPATSPKYRSLKFPKARR
jgi:5-methylcytosine-specific restriction endonuclease McrA